MRYVELQWTKKGPIAPQLDPTKTQIRLLGPILSVKSWMWNYQTKITLATSSNHLVCEIDFNSLLRYNCKTLMG